MYCYKWSWLTVAERSLQWLVAVSIWLLSNVSYDFVHQYSSNLLTPTWPSKLASINDLHPTFVQSIPRIKPTWQFTHANDKSIVLCRIKAWNYLLRPKLKLSLFALYRPTRKYPADSKVFAGKKVLLFFFIGHDRLSYFFL